MKFRTGEKRDEHPAVAAPQDPPYRLQSQVPEGKEVPLTPSKYRLAWRLVYGDAEPLQSEWTPSIMPSITRALSKRPNPTALEIVGDSIFGCHSLELATFPWDLVQDFGYIGSQSIAQPEQVVLGIWVRLKDGKQIKIWRNGLVAEGGNK